MKTFKLLLLSAILLLAGNSYAQYELELDDVDSVDAHFIINQIDEIIADESKLDAVLLSFEDLFNLMPDSITESLTEEDKVEAREEYKELRVMAKEAFSELRKYAGGETREIYIYGEDSNDESVIIFEVEYSLWKNEDEGAEVDFIYLKSDGKIYFIYAEKY